MTLAPTEAQQFAGRLTTRKPLRESKLVQYLVLGLVNTAVVYLCYSPYVFLWLRFSSFQYIRWLEGGVVFGLATGWIYALAIVWAKKRWFS